MKTRSRAVAATLLTLAGTAGVASAQSTVTIWGIVDQGVINMNDGSSIAAFPGAAGRDQRSLRHAWQPRLGFRGSEDMGGGLHAFFDIEHRFAADTGLPATPFWAGRSIVGLRSNYGTLTLGRDYLPAFYPAVHLDPFNWNTVGQMGSFYTWARYAGNDDTSRSNNMVQYKTPEFNGLSALAMVAAAEGAANRGKEFGGNVIYAQGKVYLAAAFDQSNNVVPGRPKAKLSMIGGAYDFGMVRPRLVLSKSQSFTGVDSKAAMLGISAPIGQSMILAGVTKVETDGPNNDSTKYGVGYWYHLSKRTMLYFDVGSAKTQTLTRSTGIDAGIRHSF